jgi:protoporphyrinogen oxidase
MVNSIEANGALIRAGETVQKISPRHHPRIITNASEYTFDRVVWTISLGLMPDIIHGLPPLVQRKVNDVQDMAVTCLVLIMNKRQSHLYWLNNIDRDISFGALIEHTNLVPSEYYSDMHIIYIVNYHKKEYFLTELYEEAVLAVHLPSLRRIFSGFNKNDIVKMYVFKNQHSSPVFDLAFSKKMPPYQGWLENVDVCNMTQVYPVDRNMNNCVENALKYVSHAF